MWCAEQQNQRIYNHLANEVKKCCFQKHRDGYRFSLMKAMSSLSKFPFPIETLEDCLLLDGVGSAIAAEMMKAITPKADIAVLVEEQNTHPSSPIPGKKRRNCTNNQESKSPSSSLTFKKQTLMCLDLTEDDDDEPEGDTHNNNDAAMMAWEEEEDDDDEPEVDTHNNNDAAMMAWEEDDDDASTLSSLLRRGEELVMTRRIPMTLTMTMSKS